MERATQARQRRILSAGAEEGHAGRAAVRAERSRHGDAGHIQQVDEVGVGAEPGVGAERVGADLGERRHAGRGRHGQRIDAAQHRLHHALELGQPVDAGERIGGGEAGGLADDLQRHGMQVLAMPLHDRPDGGIALGHPGALVEQGGGGEERRHVDVDEARAEPLQHLHAGGPGGLGFRIAEEAQVRRSRHADGQVRRRLAQGAQLDCARERIARVVAGHHGVGAPRVIHRQREHRDAVERPAGRHHAVRRDGADRRLQSDDVVEAGRHAARARRVGAERERHQPARHRHRRARTRSARHDVGIDGVERHRIGRAHADQAGGELIEVGLADHQRAGGDQALHHMRIGIRRIGEGGRGRRGRQPGHVDVVLDRERDAPQRLGAGRSGRASARPCAPTCGRRAR